MRSFSFRSNLPERKRPAQNRQKALGVGQRVEFGETEEAGLVGDVAAHGIGDAARSFGRWVTEARGTMRQNVSEYLQEESQAVPSRYEVERFRKRVYTLRDDVDRVEARLRRLEAASKTGAKT